MESHGPVRDQTRLLAFSQSGLNGSQGKFLAERVADRFLDSNVFSEELRVVLPRQKKCGSRAENAKAAGQARHAEVICWVMSHTARTNTLPDFFHRQAVNRQPCIDNTFAITAVPITLEWVSLCSGRTFFRAHAHAVQDAHTLVIRTNGPRREMSEQRPNLPALVIRRAIANRRRRKFTALGDVFEQIPLWPANRIESQAIMLRLLFRQVTRARPFNAAQIGVSNDDAGTRHMLLVALLDDKIQHGLRVLSC